MKWLTFDIFRGHRVRAAVSLRGRDARDECKSMAADLGFTRLAQLVQVHADRILSVRGETVPPYEEADALMTDESGLLLLVRIADCAPVFLFDPDRRCISLVHAGWRGIAAGIIGKAITRLTDEFGSDPGHLIAAVGPSLGTCCAEFSNPAEELPPRLFPYIRDGRKVDLQRIVCDQLTESGIVGDHLEMKESCTVCNPELYYSHRGGDSERMGAFLGLI